MSKDNKKTSKAEFDAAIKKLERDLSRGENILTRYVKSVNPMFVNDEAVKRVVELARGKVAETIPFADGSNQFKVEIQRKFLIALEGADDILRIATKPFATPSHNLHPRHQHRSHDLN